MKLSWLTGLRGLAAITVVLYHLNQFRSTRDLPAWSWDLYQFTEHLVFVVSIFFVLSGLLRSFSYWRHYGQDITQAPRFFPSLRDRFWRIAPAYYLALILTFGIVALVDGVRMGDFLRLFSGFTFTTWASPLTFFPVEWNGPLWFVSYDMMGWILVSIVMMGSLRMSQRLLVPYIFIVITLLVWLHFLWIGLPWARGNGIVGEWFPTYNPFLFGFHFMIGLMLWGAIEWIRRKERGSHIYFDGLFIVSSASLIAFLWLIRESEDWSYSFPHGPYHFPWTTLLIAVMIFSLAFSEHIGKWMDNKILSFFSRLSYSLYLFHMLVIVVLRKYIFINEQLSNHNWIFFSIVSLVISVSIAYGVEKILEKYIKKLS